MAFNYINIDIHQFCIFPFLDLLSQLRLRSVCHKFYGIHITDLYNIDIKYKKKLTQQIIDNYPYLEKLDAYDNESIYSVNNFNSLHTLNAGGYCGIDNVGINKCTSIRSLITNSSGPITNFNSLINLKVLIFKCFIHDNRHVYTSDIICCTNIKKLIAHHTCINNINHMTKLLYLDAIGSLIDDAGFMKCNKITILRPSNLMTSVNHLYDLISLYGAYNITNEGIYNCTKLKFLEIGFNKNINSINHLPNLEYIETCSIPNDGIIECKNIKVLITSHNNKIYNVSYLNNLIYVQADNLNYFLPLDDVYGLSLSGLPNEKPKYIIPTLDKYYGKFPDDAKTYLHYFYSLYKL